MSLTIKKKSNFKPKAAPRRPAAASTHTPDPSIPTETLSVPGQTQEDDALRETSITEHNPQPTLESTSLNLQSTILSNEYEHVPLQGVSNEHPQTYDPPIEIEAAPQRRKLPSGAPTQNYPSQSRIESSEGVAQQAASPKRKNIPDGSPVSTN